MEQLSFDEAKRLSIKKWEMHVRGNGESMKVYEDLELNNLLFNCGFCERHLDISGNCDKCEFARVAGECGEEDALFTKWTDDPTKDNAQEILDVIINLKE